MTIALIAAAWLTGGAVFIRGMARASADETFRQCLAGVRRCEPAALVALALFLAVWPVVFVGVHVGKVRAGR